MTVVVDDVEFLGPFESINEIDEKPGLYVVLRELNKDFEVIDFGFAESLRRDLIDQDDPDTFISHYLGTILVGVHYIDTTEPNQSVQLLTKIENWFENSEQAVALQT